MSELSFLDLPLQIKQCQAGIIEGLASTWDGEPDLAGDVVARGAFINSLQRHKAAGTSPALLWAHDQTQPLGIWSSVEETDDGLAVRGKMILTIPKAAQAYDLARAGALSLSIGFRPVKEVQKDGFNLLQEIDLREISMVALAANPQAKITAVKAFSTIREYENFLHKQGLSSREAKRLATKGWAGYRPDDETMLVDAIRQSIKLFRS